MADWREQLREASFRGVVFSVEASQASGGRRYQVTEYPGRDARDVDDLGRRTETTAIRGFIGGPNWLERMHELQRAIRRPGVGELVHPWLGSMLIRVLDVDFEFRSSEGRVVSFTLQFIEAGKKHAGVLDGFSSDPVAAAREAQETVAQASEDSFEAAVVAGAPLTNVETEALVAESLSLTEFLRALSLNGPLQRVAAFRRRVSRIADSVLEVVRFPREQAAALRRALQEIDSAVSSRREALSIYLGIAERGPGSATPTPFARAARALSRQLALGHLLRVGAVIAWDSFDEAETFKRRLAALVDDVSRDSSDDAYGALMGMLSALDAAIPPPDARLPRVASVTLEAPTPALVLAYRQHGTRDRADEIVRRNPNAIPHPGRVPAGVPLEVLIA